MDTRLPYQRPQWSWPAEMDAAGSSASAEPSASYDSQPSGSSGPSPTHDHAPQQTDSHPGRQQKQKQKQKHYEPRTCRICLETVQPTTEMRGSATGLFAPEARVRYVSEDPELGRLISPCKCKGSQKYVHEGCLRAWRLASPSDRNYWSCPTCQFKYRMRRLRMGKWLSSWVTRGALTVAIMVVAVFLLGFVADPIINLWIDPVGSVADAITDLVTDIDGLAPPANNDEPATWSYHFMKGVFSLGLLGFLKTFFAMSPWHWIRWGTNIGGGRRNAGRDRMQQINWALVVIGIMTFLGATWKLVNHFSRRMLESANDLVVDVQEDGDDDAEGPVPGTAEESRKDI